MVNTPICSVLICKAIWIKEKGDKFYKRGDIQAAINAYTEAIEKDKTNLIYPKSFDL